MKRIFVVLVVVVACVAGLGLYLGWFRFGSDNADGKTHITLTVDKDKIQADEKKVLDKVHDVGHRTTDKAPATTEKSGDQAPPPVQPPPNQE
jgi:hypothetical protein